MVPVNPPPKTANNGPLRIIKSYSDSSGVAEALQILNHSERAMPPLCF
jgi:hypothetical protein